MLAFTHGQILKGTTDFFHFYVLFSQFLPRFVLGEICLLPFHKLCVHMQVHAHALDNTRKKQFSGVSSRGLKWENRESNKLKRSIDQSECVLYFCYVINLVSVYLAWERGRRGRNLGGVVGHVSC